MDYDVVAMRAAADKCRENILLFESEITEQRKTLAEYEMIIARLEVGDDNSPARH